MTRTLIATGINSTVKSNLLAEHPKDVILVTYGIKGKDDDNFVKQTGEGSARLLKLKQAIGVSTGKQIISALETAGRIAAYINWGHSWDVGLYLTSGNGFYIDSYMNGGGTGEAKLKDLLKSRIKTRKHALFIFASCGTAGAYNVDFEKSFAYKFGDNIKKEHEIENKEGTWYYKITTIGATDLSNLFWDNEYYKGKIQCKDGTFKKIEKQFRITKKAVYKIVTTGWWLWEEKKKVFSHYQVETKEVKTKVSDLGKKIDVTKIIQAHDPENTSL